MRWPGNININNSLELREESHTCQTNTYYSTHCTRCRRSTWRVPNARWQYPNHIELLSDSWSTIMYKESMLGWINEYNNRLVSIDWRSTNYYRSEWLLFGSIMTDSNHEWWLLLGCTSTCIIIFYIRRLVWPPGDRC